MPGLLLDTTAFLWWLGGDPSLPKSVRQRINSDQTVFVSAASAWEIATKVRLGKLPGAVEVAERYSEILEMQGFQSLSMTDEHARRAGLLAGPHRDPFDRMLIAQSLIEDLVLVSNETTFDHYGIHRLW